jgi:lipopolysaccharide transport system ATP-binding protein
MSSELAVRAQGVGKRYRLGQQQTGYQLLSEVLAERLRSLGRRRETPRESFWALRDVGFEVRRGETFGIIGHNGAGKSTLLKILSRVTPPTTGEIRLRGRVGALLEVGTGFHAELTGRENIYLNGSILGMRRAEVDRKFDEIVEFAEVAQFIDTPVKRYSSGMYLRLAFSVAAHLEPEILIVDEVLSVGDLAFQQKCLGRMEDVASEGRTVLFVSHNLTAVSNLCPRSMLLARGTKVTEGPTSEVIERYIATTAGVEGVALADRADRHGSGRLRFAAIGFRDGARVVDAPVTGRDLDVVLAYHTSDGRDLAQPRIQITISTLMGQLMLHLESDVASALSHLPASGEIRCSIPRLPLPAGRYVVNVSAARGSEMLDWIQHATELTVAEGDFYGTGRRPASDSHRTVLVEQSWSVSEQPTPTEVAPATA